MTKKQQFAKKPTLLTADIGGTHARFGLFTSEPKPQLVGYRVYSTAQTTFSGVLDELRQQIPSSVKRACFGVAGPVVGHKAQLTNGTWSLDSRSIGRKLGVKVTLANDMDILGHGLHALSTSMTVAIKSGSNQPQGPKLIVNSGTGLGTAYVMYKNDPPVVLPTEAGHQQFLPTCSQDEHLISFLHSKMHKKIPTYEDVLSGPGLLHLYAYVKSTGQVSKTFQHALSHAKNPVSFLATQHQTAVGKKIFTHFKRVFAHYLNSCLLHSLPTGGVYFCGSVCSQHPQLLKDKGFLTSVFTLPNHVTYLKKIPLVSIIDSHAGLYGAAHMAWRMK